MTKKLNGTLMIIGPDEEGIGRKVFDLKITQTFPLLSIDSGDSKLIVLEGGETVIGEYQHISIPPDLNLHCTKSTGEDRHLKFNTDLVDTSSGMLKKSFVHLFTWMSRPISFYRQPHGTWHGAELIFPPKDTLFTKNTAIFVDFFLQNMPDTETIKQFPLFERGMRLFGDNRGYIIGPFQFEEIVRGKHRFIPKFFFALRFGYYESDGSSKIYAPFSLKGDIKMLG